MGENRLQNQSQLDSRYFKRDICFNATNPMKPTNNASSVYSLPIALCCPQNDVHTTVCADDIAELSDLQSECSILKRLLHLAL